MSDFSNPPPPPCAGLPVFRGIAALDRDKPGGANSEISYSIVGGNDGRKFSLEARSDLCYIPTPCGSYYRVLLQHLLQQKVNQAYYRVLLQHLLQQQVNQA